MGKIHYIILSVSLQYSVGCVKEDLLLNLGKFRTSYIPGKRL